MIIVGYIVGYRSEIEYADLLAEIGGRNILLKSILFGWKAS